MKISIITAAYNSADTIEETIKSVLTQKYSDIEYIVINDGSTDKTLEIIQKYKDQIAKIISRKNGGIYDTMNTGIKVATGDVVGFLNHDDFYTSDDVIGMVAQEFERSKADCVWGDMIIVDKKNTKKIVRNWKSSPFKKGSFRKGWHPPHPTFFAKKETYEKFGLYRTDLSTYADYELVLRFLEKYPTTSSYISQVLVTMRNGGASDRGIWGRMRVNIGCYRAFKENNLPVDISFILRKPFLKLWQFSNLHQ
jgi:glycosyltransferase